MINRLLQLARAFVTGDDSNLNSNRSTMDKGYSVSISTDGRSGHVHYSEGVLKSAQFYWEFGGGDVVASIDVPRAHEWDKKIPWAAGRRDEVLQRLAAEVCRQQCPTCKPSFDDGWVNLMQA